MRIDDIHLLGGPLALASSAEVTDLESELWLSFPSGYADYVTQLGEGVLGGCFVRIYPPWRVRQELAAWRNRIANSWFWDAGREVLPKERALECAIIGDTLQGDELVFHPGRPSQLFVLPRGGNTVYRAGPDLLTAVDWMCSSGQLTKAFTERNFEPCDSRRKARKIKPAAEQGVVDPPGESFNDIVAAAQRWAERRGLPKRAEKQIQFPPTFPKKQVRVTLQRQSVVFAGKEITPCFAVTFSLVDRASGLEIGVFEWHTGPECSGSAFAPNHQNLRQLKQKKSKEGGGGAL
jgi:hypothetical protein